MILPLFVPGVLPAPATTGQNVVLPKRDTLRVTGIPTVVKQPSESITLIIDFGNLLSTGETISSVDSVTPDATSLLVGSSTSIVTSTTTGAASAAVAVRVAAGTNGVTYGVYVRVGTNKSNIHEGDFNVQMKETDK